MSEKNRAIVLAAGKGTRMKQDLPKVLTRLEGKPLLAYVLQALKEAGLERKDIIIIVGFKADQVKEAFPDYVFALQQPQLGTGHAVMQADLKGLRGRTLVINGDTPLLSGKTIRQLMEKSQGYAMSLLSAIHPEPGSYGRIKRDEQGNFIGIVEARDATSEELLIDEINAGLYCFDNEALFEALGHLENHNSQNEYYLTDVAKILKEARLAIQALPLADWKEVQGVNTETELQSAQSLLKEQRKEEHD